MTLSLQSTNLIRQHENLLKQRLYHSLYQYSSHYNFTKSIELQDSFKALTIHLSGLPIGVASAALTIAARVALIGECVIIGAMNLYYYQFANAADHLLLRTTVHLLCLPFSIVSAITGVFIKTVRVAANPTLYYQRKWQDHDNSTATALPDHSSELSYTPLWDETTIPK